MIHSKYIYIFVIVGVIAVLMFIYYFYKEIISIKKSQCSMSRRTLGLESDVIKFMNSNNQPNTKTKRIDSPIMSITYNSDLIIGNDSLKYTDITDNATKKIIDNLKKQNIGNVNNSDKLSSIKSAALLSELSKNKHLTKNFNQAKQLPRKNIKILCSTSTDNIYKSDDIFEANTENKSDSKIKKNNNIKKSSNNRTDIDKNKSSSEMKSETIEINLNNIVKNTSSDKSYKNQQKYETLLDGLTNIIKNEQSEIFEDIQLNHQVIKNISDTLKITDEKESTKKLIN